MGRPRTANVMLPPDVQRVIKPSGRVYYYYAPGRGTAAAGKRIPLGSDTGDPEFWRTAARGEHRLRPVAMARYRS